MWIAKLETINCACSDNYMRNYIKYFLFLNQPYTFLLIIKKEFNIKLICKIRCFKLLINGDFLVRNYQSF